MDELSITQRSQVGDAVHNPENNSQLSADAVLRGVAQVETYT